MVVGWVVLVLWGGGGGGGGGIIIAASIEVIAMGTFVMGLNAKRKVLLYLYILLYSFLKIYFYQSVWGFDTFFFSYVFR